MFALHTRSPIGLNTLIPSLAAHATCRNQFGIGQRIPGVGEVTKAEHEKAKARIEETVEYMSTVWTDEEFRTVRHKCKNQHQE